jgi:sulfur carrier protein
MPLTVTLNGQVRRFDDLAAGVGLDRVIDQLGLKADRVAVERNGEIVPRTTWAEAAVEEADRLEIVHFVGGGTGDGEAFGWALSS